jgi:uncharacterized protein
MTLDGVDKLLVDFGGLGLAIAGLLAVVRYLKAAHESLSNRIAKSQEEQVSQLQELHEQYQKELALLHKSYRDELKDVHEEYRQELQVQRDQFRQDLTAITSSFGTRLEELGKTFHGMQGVIHEMRTELRHIIPQR